MTWALVSFAGGVFSTVLAFIVGYLTQLQLCNEDIQKSEQQAQATGKAEAPKAIPEHHHIIVVDRADGHHTLPQHDSRRRCDQAGNLPPVSNYYHGPGSYPYSGHSRLPLG